MARELVFELLLDVFDNLVEIVLANFVHTRVNLDDVALVTGFFYRHFHHICGLLFNPLVFIFIFDVATVTKPVFFSLQTFCCVPYTIFARSPLFLMLQLALSFGFSISFFGAGVSVDRLYGLHG